MSESKRLIFSACDEPFSTGELASMADLMRECSFHPAHVAIKPQKPTTARVFNAIFKVPVGSRLWLGFPINHSMFVRVGLGLHCSSASIGWNEDVES